MDKTCETCLACEKAIRKTNVAVYLLVEAMEPFAESNEIIRVLTDAVNALNGCEHKERGE